MIEGQAEFGLELTPVTIERLADYFELVLEHNTFLHLVGPCTPEEFAVRHILESMTLLEFLPQGSSFADVGTGAGLPAIPCLIAREDLSAVLIESKGKKVRFLELAAEKLSLGGRCEIVDRQFEEAEARGVGYFTCRALDKFAEKLPGMLKHFKHARFLLFGGPRIAKVLEKHGRKFESRLMPLSNNRFLFVESRN